MGVPDVCRENVSEHFHNVGVFASKGFAKC
jgi:hypothetical protein